MSRLPYPEEVSVADAIAFEAFTDEQKRIAVAGIALHAYLRERESDARAEGFDAGVASVWADSDVTGGALLADLSGVLDELQLFRQSIATADTRYSKLGEILARFSARLLA